MNNVPVEYLEQRAIEERRRLHETASELKEKMAQAREQLSLDSIVQQHSASIYTAVGAISFLLGFAVGGIFVRR